MFEKTTMKLILQILKWVVKFLLDLLF